MNRLDVKDRLIKRLLQTEEATTGSGGSEIIVKCPKCKHLHPNAGPHLYIEANGSVMRINCFHCPLSGVLTPDLLHEMDIFDSEFDDYLLSINRQGVSKIKTSSSITQLEIPTNYTVDDLKKIEYTSNRSGIDFTKKENIKKYKLIFNLNEFLRVNNIRLQTIKNLKYQNELSDHFIGFLSYNNNTINLRNVDSKIIESRYANIKIDPNIKYPFLYIPPAEIDLMTNNPMIVVAEGAYDILAIKNRFFPKDVTNIVFGAVGSAGSFKRAILKLTKLTCFYGADIVIFSDQDQSLDMYKKTFGKNLMKISNFTIIYNKFHKDFGDVNESYKFKTYKIKHE